jgi:hypothetical protein
MALTLSRSPRFTASIMISKSLIQLIAPHRLIYCRRS